jgi:drug/metabolite transporter (DMT)-like permease
VSLKAAPVTMVFIAAILAGLLNLFSKDLLNAGLGPMEICFCREGVTAVAFFLILLVIDRSAFKVRLRDLWMFALFGFFNVASNVCVFQAQETLPLEVAAVLEMTSPYFVLIFAFFLFGDKITKRKVLAVVLAFIGCLFVIGVADGGEDIKIAGIAIGLLSGITLAAFTLGSKFVGERGFSENTAMFYFFLFSAILAAPLTDFGLLGRTIASDAFIPICIVVMGLACTLAPNYLIIYGIRRVDPATVSIIITSSLIVSTICGVLAFGDEFGITDVIGIILVMAAITILEPPKGLKEKLDGIGRKTARNGLVPAVGPWASGRDGGLDRLDS